VWRPHVLYPPFTTSFVARFTTTGAFDTTFNGGGYRQLLATGDAPAAVRIDASGRIVAAVGTVVNGRRVVTLVRVANLGLLDWSFGLQGIIRYSPTTHDSWPRALTLVGDKVLVAGEARPIGGGSTVVLLERFNGNGFPDTTFDQDGIALATLTTGDHTLGGLGVDKYGRIVAGTTVASRPGFLRFTANGTLDPTFGSGGGTLLAYPGTFYDVVNIHVEALGKVRGLFHAATAPPTTLPLPLPK
jgi:uncharacterized delta-60 repeat protein